MKRNTFFYVLIAMCLGLTVFAVSLEVQVFSGATAGFGIILMACPALATLISLLCYFFVKDTDNSLKFYGINTGVAAGVCLAGAILWNSLTEILFAGVNYHTKETVRRTYINAAGERVQYDWWSAKYIIIIVVSVIIAAILAYGAACVYKYCTKKK